MKINKYLILVTVICTLIISFIFRKFIFGEYIFISSDSLAPQAIKQSLKSTLNNFPLWFPYIFSGMPTVHSLLNTNNYYFPHHIINFLHELGLPWIWNFLFHYIFSAIGMYSLIRFLKQSRLSSFLSAVLFSISPYMIAYLVHGHGSQIMTASYIPWIILFLFKIYKDTNINNFCILSLLLGLQLQRGHIQIVYYTWMMIVLFIFINSILYLKSRNISLSDFLYKKSLILLSIFLGFLTSVCIYLPILNYSKISTRGNDLGGFGIEQATQWSLNLMEITTFILPSAYGFGGQTYWGYLPFTDFPNYIGIIVICLAVIGFCKSNINKEYKIFFVCIIIVSFLISLGHNFIVFYEFLYNYLPFFNKFRVPIFILILFQFSIYVFAAIGINTLPNLIKQKVTRNSVFSVIVFLITLFTICSLRQPQLFRPELYNLNDDKILKNINSEFRNILDNIDLDNNNTYNSKDSEILDNLLDHDYKILMSKIKFSKFSNTNQYNISTLISVIKQTDSEVNTRLNNIKKDYSFIVLFLVFVLISTFAYYKYSLPKRYYLSIIITLIVIDYIRVASEIIIPSKHIPNKTVVQKEDYLRSYLSADEVVDYLKQDTSKFRILDISGNFNKNRWAAFNIETIDGYHPAKINMYDKLLKEVRNNNGGAYYAGLLQLLNVKYIIHKSKGNIDGFNIVNNLSKNINSTFSMSFFNTNNVINEDVYIYRNENNLNRIFIVENYELLNNDDEILSKIVDKNFNPKYLSFIAKNDLSANQFDKINEIKFNEDSKVDLLSWESDKIIFKVDAKSPQIILFSEVFHPHWTINDNSIEIFKVNGLFRGIIVPEGSNEFIMIFNPPDLIVGQWISIISYLFLLFIYLFSKYRMRKNV